LTEFFSKKPGDGVPLNGTLTRTKALWLWTVP